MRSLLLVLFLISVVTAQTPAKLIGQLSTLAHEVSGEVYAIDDRTFEVRNFNYDGLGPAAYFWAGKGPVSSDGFRVPVLPTCVDEKLPAYTGDAVRIELPPGQKIGDIDYLSVWCETAAMNFGDVQIGTTQREGVSTSSGPSQCGTESTPAQPATPPKLIGDLSTLAHEVSGTVYAVDDRTFEVRNLNYDGLGPAAYFWAGKGPVSSDGFRVPLLPACADEKLPQYQGDTVRVELPAGTTINDVDYLSIWCETAAMNFGDVKIGATQREGVAASSGSSQCGATSAPLAPVAKVIGNLSTLAHEVSGTVYAVDDRTFEVQNLIYDGLGPAAYFWAGKGPVSSDGFRVSLLPECKSEKLPQYQGDTIRVELPANTTINDIDYLSIWCETAAMNFGDVKIGAPERENVPVSSGGSMCGVGGGNSTSSTGGTFPVMEGYNCEDLKEGEFQVRWKVEGANIDFELVGKVEQGTYMGFGVSGSPVRTDMTGSDVVIAAEDGTNFVAIDYFLQSRAQCANGAGVCPDSIFGGNDSIAAGTVSGRRVGDTLMMKYRRPVAASDDNDKPFLLGAGERTFLSWALGPYNQEAKLPQFHGGPMSFPKDNVAFEFGRTVTDNCKVPINAIGGEPETPAEEKMEPWTRKPLVGVTDITARIGPSGGKQGVAAITPDGNSWGIAWYLSPTNTTGNDTLIPAVAVERGVAYTFRVFGGDNASNPGAHHPLYITSDADGGIATKNPEDRGKEILYAGITNLTKDGNNVTDFTATAQGTLCELRGARGSNPDDFATFDEYHSSFNNSCTNSVDASSAGILEWTVPTDFEPQVVYYQCATHRDLGFKLVVFDKGQVDMERLIRESNGQLVAPPAENDTVLSTPAPPASDSSNATDPTNMNTECTVTFQGVPVSFTECDVNDEMMKVYWTAGNDGIDTLFVAKSTGWAGLGWGHSTMVPGNAAIAYLSPEGAVSISDYALQSRSTAGVQPGTSQGLTGTFAEIDTTAGTISGRFTRPLTAVGIPEIINGENSLIWAIGPSSPSGTELERHSERGSKTVSVTLATGSDASATGNSTGAGSNSTQTAGVCVETEWLINNGHERGIYRRYGKALTYCIEGLPCGTPGHLLRRCNNNEECRLVSYKEVCDEVDFDCLMKSVEVSRLRHSYDWSSVNVHNLELTSVSQYPTAKLLSISRFIATVGNTLNRQRLGVVVDILVTVIESIKILLKNNPNFVIFSHSNQ